MHRPCVHGRRVSTARRYAPVFLLVAGLLALAPASRAQNLGPLTVGAGIQTSYTGTDPTGANFNNTFALDHARIYISGPVVTGISFMLNTDYDSGSNKLGVMDAAVEFSVNPHFNLWVGRFLPPSDRANLYGPFFANEWKVYNDGVQDGYNFVFQGRDNGAMYWGDFSKLKVAIGGFDGRTAGTGKSDIIGAARLMVDFWDKEDGYFLNSTYYGDKNILAIGAAGQLQDSKTASSLDFLLDKKVLNGGAFTIESEYTNYNGLGGYVGGFKSQGAYALASFLFPKVVAIGKFNGKFDLMGKYAKADFTRGPTASFDQKTTEINFSYIIKQFNARVMTFFQDQRFNTKSVPNNWQAGVGLQIQM